jgi:membrane protein YdbS with pleckstrin-like domain
MKTKTIAFLLKLPVVLLLIASFALSIYVVAKKLYPMTWATPIVLLIISILYIIGEVLSNKKDRFEI